MLITVTGSWGQLDAVLLLVPSLYLPLCGALGVVGLA